MKLYVWAREVLQSIPKILDEAWDFSSLWSQKVDKGVDTDLMSKFYVPNQ